ncbi:MAG: hypothetical protein WA894_17755, partial [Candidatus Acidiferrum sp.]
MNATAIEQPHIAAIVGRWRKDYARNTQNVRTKALRRILKDAAAIIGKNLAEAVPRISEARPRQQTVSADQQAQFRGKAPQWLRLFALL